MLAPRNLLSVWLLFLFVLPVASRASGLSPDPRADILRVVLTSGDTLRARCVQPAPIDMIAVIGTDESTRFLSPNHVRVILDSYDGDWTREVLENRETLGEPLPPPIRVKPGKPLGVGPRSVTKSFLITDTSVLSRPGDSGQRPGVISTYVGFDLGVMTNVSSRTAVGYGGFFGSSYDYVNAGARFRLRRWLSATSSVEIAPAIILAEGRASGGAAAPPGFSVQVSWCPSRYLTVTTEAFSVRRRDYSYRDERYALLGEVRRDNGLLLGAKVGLWPGAVAGAAAALVALWNSGAGRISSSGFAQ
jgi:hypothetical protein